ncbi:MAG: hypothetical protein IJG09_02110 [Methanobrevibacter sp.]|nr:hypothetical protein [Methanobrevibacter sp.]
MKIKGKEIDFTHLRRALLCIGAGTAVGLFVYGIFLYLNLAIFGWNLGLIFAPLAAGYVETILANHIIGENLGAISAFILFIDTTFYSFILKNPTLGWNFITAGSIIVILQAAFPTAVNYILLVVIGGIISTLINTFKITSKKVKNAIKNQRVFTWEGENVEVETEVVPFFDEEKSNQKINNLDFYFITSTDMKDKKHDIIGIFNSEVILEKGSDLIKLNPEKIEQEKLVNIKNGKDECLIKLSEKIKRNGGNGILDLSINYALVGFGG